MAAFDLDDVIVLVLALAGWALGVFFIVRQMLRRPAQVVSSQSSRRDPDPIRTAPFVCQGEEQYVAVEDGVVRRRYQTNDLIDKVACPTSRLSCCIEEIAASPSGTWVVALRSSGQGEWGYDVFRTCPLTHDVHTPDEQGYMLELPRFSADETRLVGGFGPWQGWWWQHKDDDDSPARGGLISFGFLLVHYLPSHEVQRHELQMDLPKGWIPDDPEAPTWYGARDITPLTDGVRLTLPGGIPYEIKAPLPPVIVLPTPHPAGGRLLRGTG